MKPLSVTIFQQLGCFWSLHAIDCGELFMGGFPNRTDLPTIVLRYFNLAAIKTVSSFLSVFQPIHLAQSIFQVETFGQTFILDLELNQSVSPTLFSSFPAAVLISISPHLSKCTSSVYYVGWGNVCSWFY